MVVEFVGYFIGAYLFILVEAVDSTLFKQVCPGKR